MDTDRVERPSDALSVKEIDSKAWAIAIRWQVMSPRACAGRHMAAWTPVTHPAGMTKEVSLPIGQ